LGYTPNGPTTSSSSHTPSWLLIDANKFLEYHVLKAIPADFSGITANPQKGRSICRPAALGGRIRHSLNTACEEIITLSSGRKPSAIASDTAFLAWQLSEFGLSRLFSAMGQHP
jgi:hypothetical protein